MAKNKEGKIAKPKSSNTSGTSVKKVNNVKRYKVKNIQRTLKKNVEKKINKTPVKSEKTTIISNTMETNQNSGDAITPETNIQQNNTPPSPATETTKTEQPVAQTQTTQEVVDEAEQEPSEPYVPKKMDTGRIFMCQKGTEFMDGYLKIKFDSTKINRSNEKFFRIFGVNPDNVPYATDFECYDVEEGDYLFDQLLDYEKNPEKYIKETPTEVQTIPQGEQQPTEIISDSIKPEVSDNANKQPQSQTQAQPEKTPADFAGLPLTTVNIDELINSLPNAQNQDNNFNFNGGGGANPMMGLAKSADISSLISNQNINQMESCAQSIADHINSSFQARVWGYLPKPDVITFLANQDKTYTYELKEEVVDKEVKFYLEVKKDNLVVRMPQKLNEYLKVQ